MLFSNVPRRYFSEGSYWSVSETPFRRRSAGEPMVTQNCTGLFPAILGKAPWLKLGKMIDLTSKMGEINDIEHNKDSKIYPQNQVNLDFFYVKYTP